MNNYQNIKFFNKSGCEIPLLSTSNIIFTDADNLESINDSNIVLYGYYDNTHKTSFKAKIVNPGELSFDRYNKICQDEKVSLKCFLDGVLINESASLPIRDNYFNILYKSSEFIENIFTTENDSEIDKFKIYTLKNNLDLNISCDLTSYNLLFPSAIFFGEIDIEPTSVGLVGVETLIFGNYDGLNNQLKHEYSDYKFVFEIEDNSQELQFIHVDNLATEIYKTQHTEIDLSNTQYVNIGFFPENEGVHEFVIGISIKNDNDIYKIGQITARCVAEGEDERYKTIFTNFGIQHPSEYHHIFKDQDINENNINWNFINKKSKELFLTYDEIFPYVGTYKALINSVKYLGYDDIYFREWYKIISDNSNNEVSYKINLNDDYNDNADYVNISLDVNNNYKKLNKLTMVYYINRETGETDKYNIPIIENVYNYSVDEVLIKLIALREWLHRHIIAVNCKIIDISGEGIVCERYVYDVYGQNSQNIEYFDTLEIDAKVKNTTEELIDGSAKIKVTSIPNSEHDFIEIEDFGNLHISELYRNATFKHPFINNFMIKGYVNVENALFKMKENRALWLNEGELYIQDGCDVESYDVFADDANLYFDNNKLEYVDIFNTNDYVKFDIAPIIQLESAQIKLTTLDEGMSWETSNIYKISPTDTKNYSYKIVNTISNEVKYSTDYIILYPGENAELLYSSDNVYNLPLFIFKNYKYKLYNTSTETLHDIGNSDETYIINIFDGKMTFPYNNVIVTLNFNYDNDKHAEQRITANIEYTANHIYDYNINGDICDYTQYYELDVNYTGHYDLVMYAINEYGNLFAKPLEQGVDVIMPNSDINIFVPDNEIIENDKNFYHTKSIGEAIDNEIIENMFMYGNDSNYNNELPLFKNRYLSHSLSFNNNEQYIQYSNISYSIDSPKYGEYINLLNIVNTFKVLSINDDAQELTIKMLHSPHFKYVKSNGHLANIIVYNKLYNSAVNEFNAMIIKNNNEYILKFINNENISFEEFISYINLNDNNYVYYIQLIDEYQINSVIMDEQNNTTKLSFNSLGDISDNVVPFEVNDKIKIIYSILKHNDANAFMTRINGINYFIYNPNIDEYNSEEYNNIIEFDDNGTLREIKYADIKYNKLTNKWYDMYGNVYIKLFESTPNNNVYTGYATFNINGIDKQNNIIINDRFNYKKYNKSVVIASFDNTAISIPDSLKTAYSDKYIVRYGHNDNELFQVNIQYDSYVTDNRLLPKKDYLNVRDSSGGKFVYSVTKDISESYDPVKSYNSESDEYDNIKDAPNGNDINSFNNIVNETYHPIKTYTDASKKFTKTFVTDNITTNLSVAPAHQAYVRYHIPVLESKEYIYGYNRIFTDKNRLYSYLDKSFSFYTTEFNYNDIYKYWNYNFDINDISKYYKHNLPITIKCSDYYKTMKDYMNGNLIVSSTSSDIKNIKTYWKVYKQNLANNTRKLLFKVYNNNLFINLSERGIYDIEAYNYDEYGNLNLTEKQSIIQIK